jgi:hypothetical protein
MRLAIKISIISYKHYFNSTSRPGGGGILAGGQGGNRSPLS